MMGFLTGLLPGVRDIRAPLIAGYIWLLTAWVIVEPHLPSKQEATGPLRAILALSDVTSSVVLAFGASFLAYLAGSLSEAFVSRGPLASRTSLLLSRRGRGLILTYTNVRSQRIFAMAREKGPPYEFLHEQMMNDPRAGPYTMQPEGPALHDLAEFLGEVTTSELELTMTRLASDDAQMFSVIDRIRAEAELRLAIVAPLTLLACVLAVTWNWFWLIGLVPITGLFWDGLVRSRAANDRVADAIYLERVEPPTVGRLISAAKEWPGPEHEDRPRHPSASPAQASSS
jgi:hypothetical protein